MEGCTLVLVTGANGAVGKCYLDYYLREPETICVAISRGPMETKAVHFTTDLLDASATRSIVEKLDMSNVRKVIFIHAVGKFKYERDPSQIDPEVYESNYNTFLNISEPLLNRMREEHTKEHKMNIVLCAFGSVSDQYKIPLWQSYTYAKDTLRDYIQSLTCLPEHQGLVRGVFINVSTTDTGNENALRPRVTEEEKKFWLKPSTILDRSIPHLNATSPLWEEIDVYEFMPGFLPEDYYRNHDKIKDKWDRQTGVKTY
eukprot:TRINITY_DN245_c0_g1_i2.p1 TRINITY_DN245_c0_g1~~TRINITY_DN245_c0_g1_i2.p1  ORF type:complete len:258 (-),score=52.00 TRINITY_DN245_c0_g1_i2:72-845(-)